MFPPIQHCGRCGSRNLEFDGAKRFHCPTCGWTYYQNPAAAVVGIINVGDKVLFTRRAKEPAEGTLDLPGGFVDADEQAEQALSREIREELGIDLIDWSYCGSLPNDYLYREIGYKTIDLFFMTHLEALPETAIDQDEVSEFVLLSTREISPTEIGLRSIREGVERWILRG